MSDFSDLPVLRVQPGPTDDDIEFESDMAYLRALLNAIVMARML